MILRKCGAKIFTKRNNILAYISNKYCASLVSYTWCFLTTSLWFGFIVCLKTPPWQDCRLAGERRSVFTVLTDRVQRNCLDKVINPRHLTTMDKFQGCKFIKIAFCLWEEFEFELTTTVKMACFVTNFVPLLDPFTQRQNAMFWLVNCSRICHLWLVRTAWLCS